MVERDPQHRIDLLEKDLKAHFDFCERREQQWGTMIDLLKDLIEKVDKRVEKVDVSHQEKLNSAKEEAKTVEKENKERFRNIYLRFDRQQWWFLALLSAMILSMFKDRLFGG